MDMLAVRGEKDRCFSSECVEQALHMQCISTGVKREKNDFGCTKEALYTAFALTYSKHMNDLWHDNFTLENLS